MFEAKYLYIDQWKIYYSVLGKGPHVVLFIPATFGHFPDRLRHQMKGFDLDKFTLVLWDVPPFGNSRPPERRLTKKLYSENAVLAHKLMQSLNFERYSVCGICAGGPPSMILAASHPENVRALILTTTRARILPTELDQIESYRELATWQKKLLSKFLELYEREELAKMWSEVIDISKDIVEENKGNICAEYLKDIVCPTLIICAGKDQLIDVDNSHYLHKHIEGSELYLDEEARHNLYFDKHEEFNERVQAFLQQH